MAQKKLPDSVSTQQGDMTGYQRAEELPPSKENVDLRHHIAPKRERQPGEPEVWNLSHAFDVFRAHVAGSRKVNDVTLAGARVGGVFVGHAGMKYLVLFKRERYRFFSRHFPNVPEKGHGIIANMKLVHWSAMEGMRIATVFPDGSCYWILAMNFWEYYEKYGTELTKLPEEIATPFSKWTRLF
ncbi:MAG: hypothetical protein KAX31_00245 [Thermoplasmata archaeon]|nr:hypothetical protein [Thermoplasmata archaeon]